MLNLILPPKLFTASKENLFSLPTPANISRIWNFGFILGIALSLQIITGIFLALHFNSDTNLAFKRVVLIIQDINSGWAFRIIHANGASFFFVCLYLHISRGLYFNSFINTPVWASGVTILLLTMATAFIGYVLPWGQISFWGATVITNLFSAVPGLGGDIVIWLWGEFAVGGATLSRFFAFHFLTPFIIAAVVFFHLVFLHDSGSSNPLGVNAINDKLPFHPYFSLKDLALLAFLFISFSLAITWDPWGAGDPENFLPANSLVTPTHIQPEWYFLFAYAILRAIPNKLGGVLALAGSVTILYFIKRLAPVPILKTTSFSPLAKFFFWTLIFDFFLLTWIGARPVEEPYIQLGQRFAIFYFTYFITFIPLKNTEINFL